MDRNETYNRMVGLAESLKAGGEDPEVLNAVFAWKSRWPTRWNCSASEAVGEQEVAQ